MRQASFGDERDYKANVDMIRRALKDPPIRMFRDPFMIEFHCYNRHEVDETEKRLTADERKRVRFFWLTFRRDYAV